MKRSFPHRYARYKARMIKNLSGQLHGQSEAFRSLNARRVGKPGLAAELETILGSQSYLPLIALLSPYWLQIREIAWPQSTCGFESPQKTYHPPPLARSLHF